MPKAASTAFGDGSRPYAAPGHVEEEGALSSSSGRARRVEGHSSDFCIAIPRRFEAFGAISSPRPSPPDQHGLEGFGIP